MSGRYQREDLLKLRASPLIEKPPNLPPIEEWMGPPEPSARRPPLRGKIDDSAISTESFQKRSLGLESHGRRSTTDPERIHLGPPRRSFASSNARKFGATDGEDKEKSFPDKLKSDDNLDQRSGERRSGANGGINGRHAGRTENEPRPRRFDDEDPDGRPRRDTDRTRWAGRDSQRDSESKDETGHRGTHSRDMGGRGKLDQPWMRREKPSEILDEGLKDGHGWRRAGRDRDHVSQDKIEAAPEWADAIEEPEPLKSHTHEDFLQWMESMKNRTAGDPKQSINTDTSLTGESASAGKAEPQRPALIQDDSMDKFFAKFEEKKTTVADTKTSGKAAKSRFASIFGTKEEVKPEPPNAVPSSVSPSIEAPIRTEQNFPVSEASEKKANDEAFAKLLQMLNKNQTQSTSQPGPAVKPHTPSNVRENESSRSQIQSPDLASLFTKPQLPQGNHTPTPSLDRLLESRSPADQSQRTSTKAATEDLLSLLRRSNINESLPPQHLPQYQHYQEQRLPPGLFPPSGHGGERQHIPFHDQRHEHGRPYFEDPAFIAQRYREENESIPNSQRPNINNFPEINNDTFRQNSQQPRPPQSHGLNLPPGLQRPPGLDSMPRMQPGWPNQQQPPPPHQMPQNRQGPPPPPPGMGSGQRGMPPFNNLQQHSFSNTGPPQTRSSTQQKPPSEHQPRPPPGFGGNMPPPPPGFGPPGFGSPPGPGGHMQNMAGRYGLGGGMGLADRERVERQGMFADMYASGGPGPGPGRGSGVGVPPAYR